jgi:alkylation response protein AidB-like acyl-CoA dehydrogenase
MSAASDLRAAARRFAEDEVAPFAAGWDREQHMPREIVNRMGELGFLAGPLPTSVGGGGHDNESFVAVYEEIGRACSSVRGFLAVHTGLVTQLIGDHGSDEQQRRWIPRLATGEWVGCYALTEEGAGSDVGAIATTAERVGDDWVVNGTKTWITNGGIADLAVLFARTGPGEGRHGLTAFGVELPADGWHNLPLGEEPLGHRASNHVKLEIKDLRVPDHDRIGEVGMGFRIAMGGLNHGRLGVAAGAVGIARACLDAALAHARERRQFGQRIGDFQMVQSDLAEMSAETDAAAALVREAARAADRGDDDVPRLTSEAKLFATETAQRAADKAVLLLGNRGYGDAHPVERYYRDIQGLRIYEGTNHIQKVVIARALLGKDTGPSA